MAPRRAAICRGRGPADRRALRASRRHFFLEVFGPIIEGLGFLTFLAAVVLGRASMPYVLAFLAVAFTFGIARLSTHWRIRGMVAKLGGAESWGAVERKGLRPVGAGPA